MDDLNEIRKLVKEKKLLIGIEQTMKALRNGNVAKIYFSSNCAADQKTDVAHHAKLAGVETTDLALNNSELGDVCKRMHKIMVLGVQK